MLKRKKVKKNEAPDNPLILSLVFGEIDLMKHLLTLIALVILGWSQSATAQIVGYYSYGDSTSGCQNSVYIFAWSGANPEVGGQLEVSWGDGTTDTYPIDIPTASTTITVGGLHSYPTPGTYNVDIQVYSGTNAAYVDAGVQYEENVLSPSACAYFYAYTYQQTPYVYYIDAPMDCTGADGNTTTITPSSTFGSYIGLDPSNAPYTVSINDAWLAANGYIQVSADQTITSFDADGMANNSQMTFQLTCSVPAQNPDFDINYIWPSNFVAPLQTGNLYASVCNNACSDTSDVTLTVNFPAGLTPVTTNLTNASITGNTLTFDVLGLTNCVDIVIPFIVPGNTPAGTIICFDMTAYNPNDSDMSNNSDSTCGAVWNSYDPNSKEVDHAQQIDPNTQETLEYMVHFQNDGNYNAVNVSIIDTISANLDLSTFKVVGSSAGVAVNIDQATRIVTFTFSGIMLAPSTQDLEASQGYIIYSLEEVAGLQEGDEIENTAYIYFDYNSPIVTNTAYNINSSLGITNPGLETLTLYPNPAQTSVSVLGKDIEQIVIFDLAGKEVMSAELTNKNSINVENLSNGVYTCLITSKTGVFQEKLVIKK